jgi:uncharacterized protein
LESTRSKHLDMDGIRRFARNCLSRSGASHDWEHTCRVYNLCMHIGKAEGADLETLKAAAYLHDIGRPWQDRSNGAVCHAEKGAEVSRSLLEKYRFPSKTRANIIHCILSHRYRGNSRPETLEARVLFDADKLDAIGAIGIARAFQFAGEVGARFHNPDVEPEDTAPYTEEDTGYREYRLKLSRIKDRMLTPEGVRMAQARHAFMEEFFQRFLDEHEGCR